MRFNRVLVLAVLFLLVVGVQFSQGQRRSEPYEFTVPYSQQLTADCGDFLVLSDFSVTFRGMNVYEMDGAIKQSVEHAWVHDSVYYNSLDPSKVLTGGPELGAARYIYNEDGTLALLAVSGPIVKVKLPGEGVIFFETGHIIFGPSFEILFNSGRNQSYGNDVVALCGALR